jgi:serine/threonine protein kinase
MGMVYRARDEQLHRDVAIKVLSASAFDDPAARARLIREARTASQLNHPNICTVYEVGEDNGQAYIAMELVEGRSLRDKLSDGLLTSTEALQLAAQLADALAHAHGRGVVHADLKSVNIMVTPEGRIKVLDFGLAKRLAQESMIDGTTQAVVTAPGTVPGTRLEMATSRRRFTPRSGTKREPSESFSKPSNEMRSHPGCGTCVCSRRCAPTRGSRTWLNV